MKRHVSAEHSCTIKNSKTMSTATVSTLALAFFCLCLNVRIAPLVVAATSSSTKVVRLQLIPRDSPLAATSNISEASFLRGLTEDDRRLRAIRRSHTRAAAIQSRVHALPLAQPGGYSAPMSPGVSTFLLQLSIGSPSLQYHAIMDTGSDLIWTQCRPCKNCFHQPTPIFEPSTSTTYKPCLYDSGPCRSLRPEHSSSDNDGHCRYKYVYGEDDSASTAGVLGTEVFTFSGAPFVDVAFGCGHDNKGKSLAQAAGMVGFGRGALSLPSQFTSSVGAEGVSFAYCLLSTTSGSSPLWLGPDAGSKFPSGVVNAASTSLILNHVADRDTFYYVSVAGIDVAGTAVDIPSGAFDIKADGSGGVIIDSGTTVTYLETQTYRNLIAALKSAIGLSTVDDSLGGLELCYDGSAASSGDIDYPTVTLTFHDGAKWEWEPVNYFLQVGDLVCATLGPASDKSIIGNIAQQDFFILLDTSVNRLFFARTDCASL